MKIKKIVIKGFKNLSDLTLKIDKNNTTVLIGNNGTGKSNILEAISAIFASLFVKNMVLDFKYLITYKINNNDIIVNNLNGDITYTINKNIVDSLDREYLPTQVIASYSGEDDRLWSKYYEPFYERYINAIKGNSSPTQPLIYLNKYYWNIALLTLYFHDFETFTDIRDFCNKTLKIRIDNINLTFDTGKLKQWQSNPIVSFVKTINPKNDKELSLSLDDLKSKLADVIGSERDFFQYISAAYMPKEDKLITNIEILFNDGLNLEVLSEGEKKLILTKFILETVADENALLLFDEPDSHIHISRKRDLQEQLDSFENRNNIITTHSPTLTHCFEDAQIRMLVKDNSSVKVANLSKNDSIKTLTDGIWSYQEQTIFLETEKDVLLVEGKTDVQYIQVALKKLKTEYPDLSFEIFPFSGASNLIEIIDKFKPKNNQKIIALLDRDKAGFDAIKEIFPDEEKTKETFSHRNNDKISIAMLPVKKYYRGSRDSFLIEDYFRMSKIKTFVYPKDCKSFATIGNKENIKKTLAKTCFDFKKDEFNGFKALFDLITEIKNV